MNDMTRELLKKLSNAHGVSGSEGSVISVIRKELKGYVDEMTQDSICLLYTSDAADE